MSELNASRIVPRAAARNRILAAAVLIAAAALGACSASMIDSLPTEVGGLPANTPKRPGTVAPYPSVNDVRGRSDTPLTSQQQFELEEELNNLRARQNDLQNKDAISRAQAEAEKTTAARERAIEAANANAKKRGNSTPR